MTAEDKKIVTTHHPSNFVKIFFSVIPDGAAQWRAHVLGQGPARVRAQETAREVDKEGEGSSY